jgi:hypothetical protein
MAFPDVLAAMIFWAKADPALAAIHGGRVSSRLPDGAFDAEGAAPYLRVFDVANAPPNVEFRYTTPLLQWDSFAGRIFDDRTAPDFEGAVELARTLADRLRGFNGHSPEFPGFARSIEWAPGETTFIRGVRIAFGPARQPDPEGLGRSRLDTIISAT